MIPRVLTYALYCYACFSIARSIYRDGLSGSEAIWYFLGAVLLGAAIYRWVAWRLLDRIGNRRKWRPFFRDLIGFICFIIISAVVVAAAFYVATFTLYLLKHGNL